MRLLRVTAIVKEFEVQAITAVETIDEAFLVSSIRFPSEHLPQS